MTGGVEVAAGELVARLRAAGLSIATAESLTGGQVCAALVDVPGASAVVRGGIVAYQSRVKTAVLGVDPALLERVGTVHEDVACAMAQAIRIRMDADVGLATTGNAGPEASEGRPVGRVHIAVATDKGATHRRLDLSGDRAQIRRRTVAEVVSDALATLAEETGDRGR